MKRWQKITLWTVGVITFLVLLLAVTISPVAKYYINNHSEEITGRRITVEKLRFNIFTGHLRVEQLRLREKGSEENFIHFSELDLGISLWRLIAHSVHVDHIYLTDAGVRILQRDSVFNFSDLVERFASSEEEEQDVAEQESVWKIGIYDIRIADAGVFYRDEVVEADWDMADVNIAIPGVYFEAGRDTSVGLDLSFASGGRLHTDILYGMHSSDYRIRLVLDDLSLENIYPYLRQYTRLKSFQGKLDADMAIDGNVDHLMEFVLSGSLALSELSTRDATGEEALNVRSARMVASRISLSEESYQIDSIEVSGARLRFTLHPDGKTTMDDILLAAAPVEQTAAASEGTKSKMDLRVGTLRMSDSRIDFSDHTLHRPFSYAISDLSLRSDNLTLSGRNNMLFRGRLGKEGRATLRWKGDISSMDNHDIFLTLNGVHLTDFSPYCEHYTAFPLKQGLLSLQSQNIITQRQVRGMNKMDMYKAKAEKKIKGMKPEIRIPLRLGLYILTDRTGHCLVDLPVTGSLDDPKFAYRRVIMRMIGKLILKVVASPFSFLGGGKDLTSIGLDPLSLGLSTEQYADLDQIAQMLESHAEMKISLTPQFSVDAAVQRMSEGILKMAYYNSQRENPEEQISMVDIEDVKHLSLSDAGVGEYADTLLARKGVDFSQMRIQHKARALFSERATLALQRIAQLKRTTIEDYMLQKGFSSDRFRVDSLILDSLTGYSKRDKYAISIDVDGENVTLSDEPQKDDSGLGEDGADQSQASAQPVQ